MSTTRSPLYQRGFTLPEILTVLAVIGILAAVAIPLYRDYTAKATVTVALAVADEGRLPIEIAKAENREPKDELATLIAKSPKAVAEAITLEWDKPNQAIIARANISGTGDKIAALALQRKADGIWVCLNAAKVGAKDALDEKYLPASCQGAGTALAGVAKPAGALAASAVSTPACPADQDSITLPTGAACTPKCPAGQTRDSANPTQCKEIVCSPNEIKHYDTKQCVTIPPKPTCGPGEDAFRGYDNNNYPNWGCRSACPAGQMPGMAWKCIPDPNAKPAAPPTPAAKLATPVAPPPAAPLASIKCRTCTAGIEDICELVHEEITCTAPNNYCITFVDNQADGTKIVKRGCGDFERVRTEWYQGTSDNDKCRERINTQQNLEFTCTFGCTTDNCNDNLRPAEDSLYQPK